MDVRFEYKCIIIIILFKINIRMSLTLGFVDVFYNISHFISEFFTFPYFLTKVRNKKEVN